MSVDVSLRSKKRITVQGGHCGEKSPQVGIWSILKLIFSKRPISWARTHLGCQSWPMGLPDNLRHHSAPPGTTNGTISGTKFLKMANNGRRDPRFWLQAYFWKWKPPRALRKFFSSTIFPSNTSKRVKFVKMANFGHRIPRFWLHAYFWKLKPPQVI